MKMVEYNQDEIKRKQALLQFSRETLKKEFVGIDTVIDKVIDSINTWFIFPELQEKPVIINLWGMTGVGKTALIIRLADLLEFGKKFFRYDMGDTSEDYSLKDKLENIFRYNNGMSCMLVLDEFQYAKTKNENESEIDNRSARIIWDLLDTGKIEVMNRERELEKLVNTKKLLNDAVNAGVEVRNGIVIENENNFLEIVNASEEDEYNFSKYTSQLKLTAVEEKNPSNFFRKKLLSIYLTAYN
jgi:ATP-dependent protease HslVU (ClpYQ) ATPase subunit